MSGHDQVLKSKQIAEVKVKVVFCFCCSPYRDLTSYCQEILLRSYIKQSIQYFLHPSHRKSFLLVYPSHFLHCQNIYLLEKILNNGHKTLGIHIHYPVGYFHF